MKTGNTEICCFGGFGFAGLEMLFSVNTVPGVFELFTIIIQGNGIPFTIVSCADALQRSVVVSRSTRKATSQTTKALPQPEEHGTRVLPINVAHDMP